VRVVEKNGWNVMVKVTVCPPGEAMGARDLTTWSLRRAEGKSGVRTEMSRSKWKKFKNRQKRKNMDAADRWLARQRKINLSKYQT
jgi:hypothetical protein